MNLSIPDLCTYSDPAHPDFMKSEGEFCSSRMTRVAASQRQSADITIMTTEGDKVTLSTASDLQIGYLTYNSLGRTASGLFGIRAESLAIEGSRELQIRVEGDLSAQELKDIRETVTLLENIMKDVVAGNMDRVLEEGLELEAFDSISGLEADMEYEKILSTEQVETREFTAPQPGRGKKEGRPFDPEERIVDHMMDVVRRSGVRKKNLMKPLRSMFSGFSERHARSGNTESAGLETADRIQAALFKKLEAFREMSKPEWKEHQNLTGTEIPDADISS